MLTRGQEDATNSENTKNWKATGIRSEEGARNQWNVGGHEGNREQCDARGQEAASNSEGSRSSKGARSSEGARNQWDARGTRDQRAS